MADDTFITKKIINQDVYKVLLKQGKSIDEILEHAKYTNGKVAEAIKNIDFLKEEMLNKADKSNSIGFWISQHPFKFTTFVLVATSILVSDIRHPLLDLMLKAFI